MNEIVKYKNELNDIVFKSINGEMWTGQEIKTFFALLCYSREKGSNVFEVSLTELRNACGYKHNGTQFIRHLVNLDQNKLRNLHFVKSDDTGNYDRIAMFTRFRVDMNSKTVSLRISEEVLPFLNNIREGFTRFNLSEVVNIKGKYAIELYRILKQFRTTGMWVVDYEYFKAVMGIEHFDTRTINKRILNPAIQELQSYFENLSVKKEYDKYKHGSPIIRLVFTFTPEKRRKFKSIEAEDKFADYNLEHGNITEEQWNTLGDVYVPSPLPTK